MQEGHVHISKTISKLGTFIPSVGLPAGPSCRPDAPCRDKCYALHGRYRFSNVKSSLDRNLELWYSDPELYEREVAASAAFATHFRWHHSGDIPDAAYFDMVVRVAEADKGTHFLIFSKQYEIINAYLDQHNGVLPSNLTVVLSAWGSWLPKNPYNLPCSYVRLKGEDSPIPDNAYPCNGQCDTCVWNPGAGVKDCWKLERGESVVFNQH